MGYPLDGYDGLSEDPELGFAEFVRREMDFYNRKIKDANSEGSIRSLKIHFVSRVVGFQRALSLDLVKDTNLARNEPTLNSMFDEFWDSLSIILTEIEVRHAYRLRKISSILRLPDEVREEIHTKIEEIRSKIIPLSLRDSKKEALLAALAAFSKEVDHDRTKVEAWTAFGLEVATASEEVGKKIKPIKDLMDSVSSMLGKVKEVGEMLGLPSSDKPKQIEGPRKQLPKPEDFKDKESV